MTYSGNSTKDPNDTGVVNPPEPPRTPMPNDPAPTTPNNPPTAGTPTTPGTTPTTPGTPTGTTPTQGAIDIIMGVLRDYGLESLTDWAMSALARGLSDSQVTQEMRNQPEFQKRFPAIKARADAGLPAISPGEYVQYERTVSQVLRDAGLPPSFYDAPDDFFELLMADKSPAEVQSTVVDGYLKVKQAAPEVRAAFSDWFGPDGDNALAAFFLNPDRAKPILLRMAEEAQTGGTGRRFGFNISQDTAQQISEVGTAGQAQQGFQDLAQMNDYFDETLTESTDLTAEKEGVGAVFGLGGDAAEKVRKRQEGRAAQFSGAQPGGALGEANDYGR